jgi:hypothetical protein
MDDQAEKRLAALERETETLRQALSEILDYIRHMERAPHSVDYVMHMGDAFQGLPELPPKDD